MHFWTKAAILVAAALSAGSMALAQPNGGYGQGQRPPWPGGHRPPRPPPQGRIVLYSRPYYGGRSVVLIYPTPNFNDVYFNDRAMSARVDGRWVICEHSDYRGSCRVFDSDTPTLFGLNRKASSARPVDRR